VKERIILTEITSRNNRTIIDTAKLVGRSGADGIKLQLLHVLKNTDLAKDYEAGAFSTLGVEDYARVVASCIEVIPKEMVVHRITGDAPKKILVAPTWSADKKTVLNYLNAYFDEINLIQGSKIAP
jgi:radical SAM superfamily enzyme